MSCVVTHDASHNLPLLTSCISGTGQMPKVYKTEKGRPYMRTTGGRTVGVSEDAEGRIFMFDRAGNLYYDTGDRKLGFYIVMPPFPFYSAGSCHSL
jgi:hypothetical protein